MRHLSIVMWIKVDFNLDTFTGLEFPNFAIFNEIIRLKNFRDVIILKFHAEIELKYSYWTLLSTALLGFLHHERLSSILYRFVSRYSKWRTRGASCEISTTCRHITCLIAAITHFLTMLSVERKLAFVGTIESNVSRNTFLISKYTPKI